MAGRLKNVPPRYAPPTERKAYAVYQFDEMIAQELLTRMSEGESTLQIVESSDYMPSRVTISRWAELPPEETDDFAKRFNDACRRRADFMFEEMREIALEEDVYEDIDIVDDEGNVTATVSELVKKVDHTRNKLRIDTAKWMLSRMNPGKFGDSTRIITDSSATPYASRLGSALSKIDTDD